ncbi:transposase [Rhodococcus globerulus]|uniref:transposase n=1 Tax=Rhodococcus globerulus TaxID=33008 RepID=UPI003AFB7759
MPRRYPPEFRRKVLDLLKSARTVAEVAAGLDVTEQTIYNWLGPGAHRYRSEAGAELDRERKNSPLPVVVSRNWRPILPSPNAPRNY